MMLKTTRILKAFPLLAVVGSLAVARLMSGAESSAWADDTSKPRCPSDVIRPLETGDLSSFTTWLKGSKHEDPQRVFRLENRILRCGDEDLGYVATRVPYRDYKLHLEYRWGRKNPRDQFVRNSGVLLHAVGPDGSQNGVWMTSIECQLAQGCEGDLIVIPGKTRDGEAYPATISSRTRIAEDGKTRWDPAGVPVRYSGKQFWWSKHQPFFEERIDTRGEHDYASPLGEWTQVDGVCRGNRIQIYINNMLVNEAFDVEPAAGKILLQAEGHEIFFRNLEIRPLTAEPSEPAK
ncbi:MAG: hypothetical protein RIS70_2024 [Planctomycetota bacterium]